jgi:hypothetical protein
MPSQSVSDEHMAQATALHLYRRHSAAVTADVLDGDANILSAHIAPRSLRDGPAVRLRGLWRIYSVEADGKHLSIGAADIVGVTIGHVHDITGEGLSGLNLLGFCARGKEKESGEKS